MLLIIRGPQGSGKTTIARAIQHSTGATIYDEMPAEKPADFPSEGVVIITTQSAPYPDWVQYNAFYELITPRRASLKKTVEFWRSKWDGEKKAAVPSAAISPIDAPHIQKILESLPLPGSSGEQFTIFQNRHYPITDDRRFGVRVLKKNFLGNDVSQLLIEAKAFYAKKTGIQI